MSDRPIEAQRDLLAQKNARLRERLRAQSAMKAAAERELATIRWYLDLHNLPAAKTLVERVAHLCGERFKLRVQREGVDRELAELREFRAYVRDRIPADAPRLPNA